MSEPFTPEDVERGVNALTDPPELWEFCTVEQAVKTVLAALAEAGRLREPGDEWETGYEHAPGLVLGSHLCTGGTCAPVRRWVGPWLPADPAPAVSPVTEENPNPEVDHG